MLRTAPVDQLSLRRVAEQVGVSHQAPYVHFGSKRRFLAAVAGSAWTGRRERRRRGWQPLGSRRSQG